MRQIKYGHSCDVGGWGQSGDIIECECGRRYKFSGLQQLWVQTWPSVFGFRRRPERGRR